MSDIPHLKTVLVVVGVVLFIYLCIKFATSQPEEPDYEDFSFPRYCKPDCNSQSRTKCASCDNCVYCISQGKCIEGDELGPLFPDANCSRWVFKEPNAEQINPDDMTGQPVPDDFMTGQPVPDDFMTGQPVSDDFMTGQSMTGGYIRPSRNNRNRRRHVNNFSRTKQ